MSSTFRRSFFCLLLLSACFRCTYYAQTDSTKSKRFLVSGLPVVFYTPETRLGLGATGLCLFNFKSDTLFAPRSTVSLGFVYTQNKQILLSLPFYLFIKNRKYLFYGEVTYNRFNYNFYGVGNDIPPDYVERYGVEFPRVRVTFLKRVFPHVYAGLRYAFDKFRLFDLDSAGMLAKGLVPGSNGGMVSGAGVVFMLDRRDNVYFPSKGEWAELVFYRDDPATGSSFRYTRIAFDFAKYLSYKGHILALNAYTIFSPDVVPFFQMGTLGGAKKMRGFYEGRYRDNNAIVLQAEYRKMIYGPLGVAVFGGLGQVAPSYDKFNYDYWKMTYGMGLRLMFDQRQKINLRFDMAVGNGKLLPYFTVGEAF